MKTNLIPSVGINGVRVELDVFESNLLKTTMVTIQENLKELDVHNAEKHKFGLRFKGDQAKMLEDTVAEMYNLCNFIAKITDGSSAVEDVRAELFEMPEGELVPAPDETDLTAHHADEVDYE